MIQEAPETEPRWTALIAAIVVPLLNYSLPTQLKPPLDWLFPTIAYTLLLLTTISHRLKRYQWNQVLGFALSGVMTLFTLLALIELVKALVFGMGNVRGQDLIKSAALLWLSNVVVFALWYWRLDAGGPNHREIVGRHHDCGAFLFPQMTMDPEDLEGPWQPHFTDYLFLAFNTSTALSPADTSPLSRPAKWAMMVQSLISLTIIGLVAARGVNIL